MREQKYICAFKIYMYLLFSNYWVCIQRWRKLNSIKNCKTQIFYPKSSNSTSYIFLRRLNVKSWQVLDTDGHCWVQNASGMPICGYGKFPTYYRSCHAFMSCISGVGSSNHFFGFQSFNCSSFFLPTFSLFSIYSFV